MKRRVLEIMTCFCIIAGLMIAGGCRDASAEYDLQKNQLQKKQEVQVQTQVEEKEDFVGNQTSYQTVYASMNKVWQKKKELFSANREMVSGDVVEEEAVVEDGAVMEAPAMEEVALDHNMSAEMKMEEIEDAAYGTTNVQTVGVDEGDIVKNDGRYLYQIVTKNGSWPQEQEIQIVDTQGGLKELSRIEGFESISEFYVWEDLLIAIENKYLDEVYEVSKDSSQLEISCDIAYDNHFYHEISIFNLKDPGNPQKVKTFTMQGRYQSSRIADGYFYGFSRYYASPGEGEKDYDAYIPTLDGVRLEADQIFLPEESEGTAYLVMVSIDLQKPEEFVQTAGIVSDSEKFYVSGTNIYVTDTKYMNISGKGGWSSDKTALMRFSYDRGKFALKAQGEIKGNLDSTFSMDEYENHLRVVTTVREYKYEMITDDRTGEELGLASVDEKQTNALYILDENLKITGKIEGLAEDEQIYSARFMGETGYFVTFRQTDPLFTVDLADPTAPKVLSELKVSGFSEYLHIYGENRLFGLGMEADEETGIQSGMKLSMFDTSDLTNVKEISRLHIGDYYYSEALYNHHAVLIHPSANLIGFEAEGSDESGYRKEYFVYSYEEDEFVRKLKLDTKGENDGYYTSRGTFIGNVFYLLTADGNVKSYDLNTGEMIESLKNV